MKQALLPPHGEHHRFWGCNEPAVADIFYHADYLDIQALDPLAQWVLDGPELAHEAFIDQSESAVEFNVRVTNLTSAQDGDTQRGKHVRAYLDEIEQDGVFPIGIFVVVQFREADISIPPGERFGGRQADL